MIDFYTWATASTRRVAVAISAVNLSGLDAFPASGPVILCPNHLHFADPPVIAAFMPRRVHYMVKIEAWKAPFLGLIPLWFDAFPVRRGEADLAAYRKALKLLGEGKVVGIFPEGHRSKDGHLQAGQPGAIILAQRSGAPIVPVGIRGVREVVSWPGAFQRRSLRISVGKPYHPPRTPREELPALTEDLMRRIASLIPVEEGTGQFAGRS